MSQVDLKQKLKEWNGWLGEGANTEATIYKEMVDLAVIRHVFTGVCDMVMANPRLQQHSAFYEVFGLNYAHSILMYLRRQVRIDGISMRKLLGDILKYHKLVTRQWYVELYTSDVPDQMKVYKERNANTTFSRHFAGQGNSADHLDWAKVQADIDKLDEIRQAIQEFVNWRVAHAVLMEPKQVPTYAQLDEWANFLESLLKKYLLLLQGEGFNSVMPILTHDWQDIFRVAWLPSKDSS